MDYQVYSDKRVSRTARRLVVIVPDLEPGTLATAVDQVTREHIGQSERLVIYLYRDAQAIQWNGWMASAVADNGQPPVIRTDNDPELRQEAWQALQTPRG